VGEIQARWTLVGGVGLGFCSFPRIHKKCEFETFGTWMNPWHVINDSKFQDKCDPGFL